ncbi:hypothetical protein CYMTET_51447, partial [Cymbomonas tetramitiformis]
MEERPVGDALRDMKCTDLQIQETIRSLRELYRESELSTPPPPITPRSGESSPSSSRLSSTSFSLPSSSGNSPSISAPSSPRRAKNTSDVDATLSIHGDTISSEDINTGASENHASTELSPSHLKVRIPPRGADQPESAGCTPKSGKQNWRKAAVLVTATQRFSTMSRIGNRIKEVASSAAEFAADEAAFFGQRAVETAVELAIAPQALSPMSPATAKSPRTSSR